MAEQITITKAQPIQYMAPLWQVDVQGPPLTTESLEWLNDQPFSIVASHVQGWYPYSHLIEVKVEIEGTWQYLALAQGQVDCTPVKPGNECPSCNENREDWLIWRGDWVVCSTCGYIYNPGKERFMDEMDQSGVYPV